MTHRIRASSATFLLALTTAGGALAGGSGCSSSGGTSDSAQAVQQKANAKVQEVKREAVETAARAQSKAAEARREASREAAEAAQAANAAIVEANQKARGEVATAQANANVEVRKANRKTARGTTDLREWSQKKMDDLDNAIDAARAKEQSAAPRLRADFEAGMKVVEMRRDVLRAEVASIETQSEKDMDAFKQRLEKEGNLLRNRLEELSTALSAKRESAG
jgi:colicin import membrane protein